MVRFVALVVIVALTGSTAWAEDAVVIKLKPVTATDERVVRTSLLEFQTKFTDDAGQVLKEQSNKTGETLIYVQTVVPVAVGGAARWQRKYEKAEQLKAGKTTEFSFQGKTLTVEPAGKRRYTLEGDKEPSAEEVEFLERQFAVERNEDAQFLGPELPQKAVLVGDSWPIDLDNVAKQLAGSVAIDVKASKANGKLLRVYERDGSKFGVMEFHLLVAMKEGKLGDSTVKAASQISLALSADLCIDGTRGSGTMKTITVTKVARSFLTDDNKEITQTSILTHTSEYTRTDLGK